AAQHHAGSGAAKNREQSEVLQVDNGERGRVNRGVEFAEGKLPAERAKKGQEAAAGEKEARRIDETGKAALVDWRDRILADALVDELLARLRGRCLWPAGVAAGRLRGQRNINEHLRFVRGFFRRAADGDGKREVVGRSRSRRHPRRVGDCGVDAGNGNVGCAFKRQLGLFLFWYTSPAARAVGRDSLGDFSPPGHAGVRTEGRGSARRVSGGFHAGITEGTGTSSHGEYRATLQACCC